MRLGFALIQESSGQRLINRRNPTPINPNRKAGRLMHQPVGVVIAGCRIASMTARSPSAASSFSDLYQDLVAVTREHEATRQMSISDITQERLSALG